MPQKHETDAQPTSASSPEANPSVYYFASVFDESSPRLASNHGEVNFLVHSVDSRIPAGSTPPLIVDRGSNQPPQSSICFNCVQTLISTAKLK